MDDKNFTLIVDRPDEERWAFLVENGVLTTTHFSRLKNWETLGSAPLREDWRQLLIDLPEKWRVLVWNAKDSRGLVHASLQRELQRYSIEQVPTTPADKHMWLSWIRETKERYLRARREYERAVYHEKQEGIPKHKYVVVTYYPGDPEWSFTGREGLVTKRPLHIKPFRV